MVEFSTLENVKALFYSVNCIGNNNCFFVAYKDLQRSSGLINGMDYPYYALLINQTEYGLGIFYLNSEKLTLINDLSKLMVCPNTFFFIRNEDIENIEIKNWALINSKTKRITIKLKNKQVHKLYANMNEKLLPYQAENIAKFVGRYGN